MHTGMAQQTFQKNFSNREFPALLLRFRVKRKN
jgi:hypothetical protein